MLNTNLIRPLGELLTGHRDTRGDRFAFRDMDRAVTWDELERRTATMATHLRRLSHRGSSIAICVGNRVEGIESYLGVIRAGNVAAYLNPRASDNELDYMVDDCAAPVIIADGDNAQRAVDMAARNARLEHVFVIGDDVSGAAQPYLSLLDGPGEAPDDLGLDDPAFLLYTSGTTGRPKGVVLTQRSTLWVVAACWTTALGLTGDDTLLSPLPLFHSYALDLTVLAIVATGASQYLLPGFSTERVMAALRDEGITVLAGVPTMFHYLVEATRRNHLDAPLLRMSVSAGAIMPASLNQEFEALSGVPLLDGYGITETSTMVTINWPTGERPPGSCGLPVPGCAVRIVDPTSGEDVAFGDEGELIVRGPQVMQGYFGNKDATGEALRDGWYHSGDLARSDPHGYLTITGRIKELIIRGGENIYPAEVEQVVAEHPQIRDAAVVGIPNEALGEVVVAFVVPEPGDPVSEDALRDHCRSRLAHHKVPIRFETIDEIPRTGSGKIQRHKLVTPSAREANSAGAPS